MNLLNKINSILDIPGEDTSNPWRHIVVIRILSFLAGILLVLIFTLLAVRLNAQNIGLGPHSQLSFDQGEYIYLGGRHSVYTRETKVDTVDAKVLCEVPLKQVYPPSTQLKIQPRKLERTWRFFHKWMIVGYRWLGNCEGCYELTPIINDN